MATTINGNYLGNKRISVTHELSGESFFTDAPLDNNGKGESFSPTDLVGTATAACILTIMAIKAEKMGLGDFSEVKFEVVKEMSSSPRRISDLKITFHMPANISKDDRAILEATGKACPVHRSLHPDVNVEVDFSYDLE